MMQSSFLEDKARVYKDVANLLIDEGRLAEAQHGQLAVVNSQARQETVARREFAMKEEQVFWIAVMSVVLMSPLVEGCLRQSGRGSYMQPTSSGRGDTATGDSGRVIGAPEEAAGTSGPVYRPAPEKEAAADR
jgi:hypothetical protein